MAIREIVYMDNELLRQQAEKVTHFSPEFKQLTLDMLETMRFHTGVGLAGPQVGVMQRIFVAEIPVSRLENDRPHPQSGVSYIFVNPEVIETADTLVTGKEGCLSMPTWFGLVERPTWVNLKAQDINGRPFTLKVNNLLARIFLHEIDHLNGILFTDHITDPEKVWQVSSDNNPATEPQ